VIKKKDLSENGYYVLKNEAMILKEMEHPNIVRFLEVLRKTL